MSWWLIDGGNALPVLSRRIWDANVEHSDNNVDPQGPVTEPFNEINGSLKVIEQKILLIRSQKVMLDRDLAQLYGVETRVLNQAVRRNLDRFPDDFMFSLTREEIARISQFVTSSNASLETLKFSKNVMVFTEYGIAMLSSVLNSSRAIQVNIQIMRTFGKLRK